MMFLQQELYLTLVPQRNTQTYRGIISVTQNTQENEDVSWSLIGNTKDGLSLGPGPLLGRTITGSGIVTGTSIKYQVLPYFTGTSAFQGHCYSCWLVALLTHMHFTASAALYSQWPFQSTLNTRALCSARHPTWLLCSPGSTSNTHIFHSNCHHTLLTPLLLAHASCQTPQRWSHSFFFPQSSQPTVDCHSLQRTHRTTSRGAQFEIRGPCMVQWNKLYVINDPPACDILHQSAKVIPL